MIILELAMTSAMASAMVSRLPLPAMSILNEFSLLDNKEGNLQLVSTFTQ